MTKTQAATADVFLIALKALPKRERDAVLVQLARDKTLGRDILDLALIVGRRSEPSRPFREYLMRQRTRRATLPGFARGALHRPTNGAK